MTNSKELREILDQKEFPTERYMKYAADTSNSAVNGVRKKIERKLADERKLKKQERF